MYTKLSLQVSGNFSKQLLFSYNKWITKAFMRKVKIEIPIVILTVAMLALLALSGKQVYKSLSEIVDSMLAGTRPDNKLILVKDIDARLNEVENTVKLYSLSENRTYLDNYYSLNNALETKLTELQNYAVSDSTSQNAIDSLISLAQQKMVIWRNVLNLHLTKENEHEAFNQYFETLDTVMVVQDTIRFEEPEKVGFFKRLFGKKAEPPQPVIVDRTIEKQTLRDEMQQLEQELKQRNRAISSKEAAYMQSNLDVSVALTAIISKLELQEQKQLLQKTEDAEAMALETYKRLGMFALSVVLLILLVLLLFFRDLRKSRAYQKALQQAKTQAENLARTKELFVATVSHEMRTPVNAIFGLAEQLLQQPHDTKTEKDLKVIFESTKHLTGLVNDTFDFTRIENRHLQLKPVHFSLNETLEKVLVYNKNAASEKGLSFSIQKNFDRNIVVYGDEGRFKQIVNNLVTNAIKFTDNGMVKINVDAEEKARTVDLKVEVTDTGIGIAREHLEQIFDDFVQLETDVNKKAGGTGLGLYIVKKLVDLLGGEITVESEPGKGTTFWVKLDFEKGDAQKMEQIGKSFTAPESLKNKRVLIVDDEAFNRHLLKNIFTKWQVDFDEAENGKQALEQSQDNNYALILMDIRMPEMDGIEAASKIRERGTKAKIIALSANRRETKDKDSGAGVFDRFLGKPFNEAGLYTAISETMADRVDRAEKGPASNENFAPDLAELEHMANGDDSFLSEMISLFVESSSTSLKAMDENLQHQNFQAIADLAHKLAAPVKYMNVTAVYNNVKELQNLAENNPDVKILQSKLEQLSVQIEKLNNDLQDLLAKRSK